MTASVRIQPSTASSGPQSNSLNLKGSAQNPAVFASLTPQESDLHPKRCVFCAWAQYCIVNIVDYLCWIPKAVAPLSEPRFLLLASIWIYLLGWIYKCCVHILCFLWMFGFAVDLIFLRCVLFLQLLFLTYCFCIDMGVLVWRVFNLWYHFL